MTTRNHVTESDLDRMGYHPCPRCQHWVPQASNCLNCGRLLEMPIAGPNSTRPATGTGVDPSNANETSRQPDCKHPKGGRRQPNKTELRFRDGQPPEVRAAMRYEPITLRLANGHRYTPDWGLHQAGDARVYEIKDSRYRHASYQRSRLAFDQAAIEFPCFRFFWCEWDGSQWTITERTNT